MTTIYMYAGANHEDRDAIYLVCADPQAGRNWSYGAAITHARSIIKSRGLVDVAIRSGVRIDDSIVWADSVATERLYPHTGPSPKPVRRGVTSGNITASSAVRCPWDNTRYKMIDFA